MDRLIASHLRPYVPLPQARPTRPIQGRPACCASAVCELCPVDARFSALNGLKDVLDHSRLRLMTETVVERIRLDGSGRRARALECIRPGQKRLEVKADRYVVAAGGLESPGLLLRSGLDREDVGRFLFDHEHRTLLLRLRRQVGAGEGNSLSTGLSRAFLEGPFRAKRSAAFVTPHNPGVEMSGGIATALVEGTSGAALKKEVLDRWRHTLPLDVLLEDVPQAGRRVTLSPNRDSFGIPRLRVAYGPSTEYEDSGWRAAREEIVRRLAPLGVVDVSEQQGPRGGQILGTCRMGDGDTGVVDRDLRHLDVENLYVAGSAVYPTYSPAHATLTLAALAIRLGDMLASSR